MATTKLATLAIRTLAKPISTRLKAQAKEHESFRNICVGLAQRMYRGEVKLRTNLLGEPAKHIRPLSESRAIENGANLLAEGFLFSVAAGLILGEAWRSSRSQSKRRDDVDDKFDEMQEKMDGFRQRIDVVAQQLEEANQRNEDLTRVLARVVEIGLRGGLEELRDTPLRIIAPPTDDRTLPPAPSNDTSSS